MSKTVIPLVADDVSVFARKLAQQLKGQAPSHLKLLNMIARSSGFQNFQHMRKSQTFSGQPLTHPQPLADMKLVARCLQHFEADGQLTQWPSRRTIQDLAMWAMWAKLPSRASMNERQISALLEGWHQFGDPALLRRSLVTLGLVRRNKDGSDYQRAERTPPPEALALFQALKARHL